VVFLCSRAVPFGGFLVTLAGGVALARSAERQGGRRGFGASLAAMLQSVAVMGPARLGVPLTQALSAPLLGRMEAHGIGTFGQVLACGAIRLVQNTLGFVFFVGVITGLEAYAATYDNVIAGLIALPEGVLPALAVSAGGIVAWAVVASTIQVRVYRRGLRGWRGGESRAAAEPGAVSEPGPQAEADRAVVPGPDARSEPVADPPAVPDPEAAAPPVPVAEERRPDRGFDPRALAITAIIAFGGLLASFSWPVLAAASAWLVVAWIASARGARGVVPTGLALAAILGLGAFAFAAIGGLGLDVAARRAVRAALLVLVATWLRAAAGSDGLREVARRTLRRLRRVPALDEASEDLDELGATPRLAAAGRTLLASLRGVRRRPLPLLDAILVWVRREAVRFQPVAAGPPVRIGVRPRDLVLSTLALAPAAAAGMMAWS
jgi:hypothetical protein